MHPRYNAKSTSVEVSLKELGMGSGDMLVIGFGEEYSDAAEMERTVEQIHADIAHATLCALAQRRTCFEQRAPTERGHITQAPVL